MPRQKENYSKEPTQKIIQHGIYNTILSAPTRSGKGVSSVITTLLPYGDVIVLDFKGEIKEKFKS